MYPWLIEERFNDSDYTNVTTALTTKGINFTRFPGLFNGFSTHIDKLTADPFIFQGTISGALIVRNMPNCIIPFTPNNYSCTSYYPHMFSYLLNRDYEIYQLGVINGRWKGNDKFVRPDSGLKTFCGSYMTAEDINNLSNRCAHFDPTDLVIMSTPKTIVREWRLLFRVVPGKLYTVKYITGSQYHEAGELYESADIHPAVIKYATDALNSCRYFPDPLFYIDIADCQYGTKTPTFTNLYINELSAFMCAGLYKCDVNKIIDEINSIEWI